MKGFGKTDVSQGASVALGSDFGWWDAAFVQHFFEGINGLEGIGAEGGIEGDEGALMGFGVVDHAFWDGDAEHFFEAEGLGAELDAVVEPARFFAGFVFDGAGGGDAAVVFLDFDEVGFADEAEAIGPEGEGAEEFPAGAVFEAWEVGVLVGELAEEGEFIVFE